MAHWSGSLEWARIANPRYPHREIFCKSARSGVLKSAFWGAVSGAVTFGIGSAFTSAATGVTTQLAKSVGDAAFLVKAAAHGISQGLLSMVQNHGAGFLSGAAAGFFGDLGATAWSAGAGKFASSTVGTIAFGALSGGVGAELTGGNFWQGAVTGGIVAGLNTVFHQMEMKEAFDKSDNGKKEYIAVVTGESSNNEFEAEGIGETIIHRATLKGVKIEEGFLNKLGGKAQYNAIGETDYNNIMKQSLSELVQANKNNPYYLRIKGALTALYKAAAGLPGITNGAYFWNATWQKNMSNIGQNFRALNKGIFEISAEIGQTTFFKYSNSNKHWP